MTENDPTPETAGLRDRVLEAADLQRRTEAARVRYAAAARTDSPEFVPRQLITPTTTLKEALTVYAGTAKTAYLEWPALYAGTRGPEVPVIITPNFPRPFPAFPGRHVALFSDNTYEPIPNPLALDAWLEHGSIIITIGTHTEWAQALNDRTRRTHATPPPTARKPTELVSTATWTKANPPLPTPPPTTERRTRPPKPRIHTTTILALTGLIWTLANTALLIHIATR